MSPVKPIVERSVKARARTAAGERLHGKTGRAFWRALEELADLPAFRRALDAEFPQAFAGLENAGRRDLLKAMGASLAMAGLVGCSAEADPDALPYVTTPPGETIGNPRYYATAVTFGGYAQPVLGETHEGRPTKLEGLADHPACLGGSSPFVQAALLDLYDPDRSRAPLGNGQPTTWAAFDTAMVKNARRLDAVRGEGFRLLLPASSSPTLARQLDELSARWPLARWHAFEPVNADQRMEAARRVFGRPLEVACHLDACRVIVSFDADLLGPGPHQVAHGRAWSARRAAFHDGDGDCRLLVVEPAPTLTGAMAADRLIASPGQVETLLAALAARLGVGGQAPASLTARQSAWLDDVVARLQAAGPAGLVAVGADYPADRQALGLAINARLGSVGTTLSVSDPILIQPPDGSQSLAVLAHDMAAGLVDTLVIFDANPAYAAPADLGFVQAMDKVRLRVHASLHRDETAQLCHWHVPVAHDLESWGDARAVDGRPSLIQPLVRPFYDTRPRPVLIENVQGRLGQEAREIVRATWAPVFGADIETSWREALLRGYLDQPAAQAAPTLQAWTPASAAAPSEAGGLSVLIRPDPCIWDGARANNPWLQELPKPFNTVTWDNVIAVSPALARAMRLESGDVLRLSADGREVEGPVWITPGLERQTVVLYLGYGRRIPGQLGDGVGYDAYPMVRSQSPWRAEGARAVATGRRHPLAATQLQTAMDGHDFVRTAPREAVRPVPPQPDPPSFYPAKPQTGEQWGMAIDLDLCIGCNACVVACVAENNIPMVGKAQVAKHRMMHWLRIDRYYEGEPDDPRIYNQPVPCMHCEQAPCEMGCPVNAAVHSHDGLNLQVYNRCIGTRTCSSYCPYKVRRFNWFDFTGSDSPELRAARNPDVTVRARGVMEKCTYCVQRIEKARIGAKVDGRDLKDGDVRTACQQACPTNAIVFGDINDPTSAVSKLKAQQRNYSLLEEANTRPRTTYLARIDDGDA